MELYDLLLAIALIIAITAVFIWISKLPFPKRFYFKAAFFALAIVLIWNAYPRNIYMKGILTFIAIIAIAGEYEMYREFKKKNKK